MKKLSSYKTIPLGFSQKNNPKKNLLPVLLLLSLLSCTMAPDMKKSDIVHPDKFKNETVILSADSLQKVQWWKAFNNAELNHYVEKAIQNNLDIKLALERVKQFEAIVGISSAALYPQLSASGSASKSKQKMINNFIPQQGDYIDIDQEQYNVNLKFVFNLDIWGKFRNMRYAAVADWKAMKYDLRLFYQNIITQTISSYFELRAMQDQLELTQKIVSSYSRDYQRQKDRYRSGIGSKYLLRLSEQVLTANQARLEAEKAAFKKMKYQFSILLGEYPQENFDLKTENEVLKRLPKTIPSVFLKQRSDIQAAYQRMDAARNRVGAARADFFPQLSLSADFGWGVKDPADLFKSDLLNKTFAGAIGQSIFDGFAKTSVLDQRWAEYEQSFLNYKKTILKAFSELESALIDLSSITKQFNYIEQNQRSSKSALNLVQKRYISGISSYKDFLDNKRSFFNSEQNLIQAKKNQFLAQLRLHQAIGGKWLQK